MKTLLKSIYFSFIIICMSNAPIYSQSVNICQGDSVVVHVINYHSGSFQWQSSTDQLTWNNIIGATADTVKVLPTITHYYRCIISDGTCQDVFSDTAVVTVFALPIVTFTGVLTPQCTDATVYSLTGGSPLGGIYTGTGVTSGNFNASVAGVGTHTITYTYLDGNGCIASATNTIVVNALPVVTFAGSLTFQCVSSTTYLLTGGSPPGGTYSGSGVTGNNFDASVAGVGSHVITYSYTDGNGCSASAINTIIVNELPIASAGVDQSILCGGNVVIGGSPTGSGGTVPYSYSWSPSNTLNNSTNANPTATPSVTTIYTVTVTDYYGCVATDSMMVTTTGYTPGSQTFNNTGTGSNGTIQTFTVPTCVTSIVIEAWGAQGGTDGDTRGARMMGTFSVTPGDVLNILVGQQGEYLSGGGGTFVTTSTGTPLIIAGGGGGCFSSPCPANETAGRIVTSGGTCGTAIRVDNGDGGVSMNTTSGAGGGFYTDGANFTGGKAYLNGGLGGVGERIGGYGGGGSRGGLWGQGAGGGYSGGSCGDLPSSWFGCGGGGSYNIGTNQSNTPGVRVGQGLVTITW